MLECKRLKGGIALLVALGALGCVDQADQADRAVPFADRTREAANGGDAAHLAWLEANYDKSEHMVAMRDGAELYTIVYTPRDVAEPAPVMLYRTPYSIAPYEAGQYRNPLGPSAEFDRAGYVFVFQDVRGKFRSQGDFEVIRPLAPKPKGPDTVDESTDNYDTIEWALANLGGHNGKVGQWGISYSGWQTVMGMVDAHPALAASSPQASPSDMFIGDDWHHNGAFRIMYAFSWLAGNARRRDAPTEERTGAFDYGTDSGYDFFLEAGAASNIDDLYFQGDVPAWNDFMEHDTYDDYWQRQNALPHMRDIHHPILNVAGWFDTEDFYGPMSIYRTIEAENPGTENVLAAGPWLHGGWSRMLGDNLGCIEFGDETSVTFQREVQFPFFEHHLRGAEGWTAPEAVVFETGSNIWRTHESWPPAGVEAVSLYLDEGGTLSFEAPSGAGRFGQLHQRSQQSRAILRRRTHHTRAPVEGGRPAVRVGPGRCPGLPVSAARGRPHHSRADPRRHLRLDDGDGLGLGREGDRHLPGRRARFAVLRCPDGRLSDAPCRRGHAGPLPRQLRASRGDGAGRGHSDSYRSAGPVSHLQGGAPDHGARAEFVVPRVRPQHAAIRG